MIAEFQYPSLLHGVSQQTPRERVNGQLTEQINMLSDPVTGVRRRPGLVLEKTFSGETLDYKTVYSQYLELGGKPVNVFIFTKTGTVKITDKDFKELKSFQFEYLKAKDASSIQITNNSGLGWILNTEQKPEPSESLTTDPKLKGFIDIRTGAFLKSYNFEITTNKGAYTVVYQTPNGTEAGDASISTPDGVAKKIYELISGGHTYQDGNEAATGTSDLKNQVQVYLDGSSIFLKAKDGTTSIAVKNRAGASYASTSKLASINNVAELPPSLPKEANDWVISVGTSKTSMQYYKYDAKTITWSECAAYDSYSSITNMPLQISLESTSEVLVKKVDFEGRLAGDSENNPYPNYIFDGITGIGTFMGRLVLLSGPYVCLSASRYPIRTMRSTVTEILDTDPMEVASGASSSASFVHAVQFNKDLVVIASTHQAVIPTGNNALTPTTAMLTLTSEQAVDVLAKPQVVGQSLFYSTPISDKYFGVGELVPSSYTNSVYTAQGMTDHIPKYMHGRCRHIASGSSINLAAFTSTENPTEVTIYEYFFAGQERQLNSWHKWCLPANVCTVHFAKDKLIITLDDSGDLVVCSVDPRSSPYLAEHDSKPFLDGAVVLDTYLEDGKRKVKVPKHIQDSSKLVFTSLTSGLELEPVGFSDYQDGTVTLDRSYKQDKIIAGWKFYSRITLNAPVIYTTNQYTGTKRLVSGSKDTVLKTTFTVQNTGPFSVAVADSRTPTGSDTIKLDDKTALVWSSRDLNLGKNKIATIGDVSVPCRTNANTTSICVFTEDAQELNVLGAVYSVKLHQRKDRQSI